MFSEMYPKNDNLILTGFMTLEGSEKTLSKKRTSLRDTCICSLISIHVHVGVDLCMHVAMPHSRILFLQCA